MSFVSLKNLDALYPLACVVVAAADGAAPGDLFAYAVRRPRGVEVVTGPGETLMLPARSVRLHPRRANSRRTP